MGALSLAAAAARPNHRKRAAAKKVEPKSFIPYLPALTVAIIQDCLDLLFMLLLAVPGGVVVSIALGFVFSIGLGFLTATLLFLFTGSNVSFVKRFLGFGLSQVANILPVVSLLPLATISVLLVYFFDKQSHAGTELPA
jgi:hypothetical protein